MRRRLVTIASAMSLLLCVATVVLWVRTYTHPYAWDWNLNYRVTDGDESYDGWELVLAQGGVNVSRIRFHGSPYIQGLGLWMQGAVPPQDIRFHFYFNSQTQDLMLSFRVWAISLLLVGLPIAVFTRRCWRAGKSSCPICSYDLTGNTSGVCPECGTAIPKPVEKESPQPT